MKIDWHMMSTLSICLPRSLMTSVEPLPFVLDMMPSMAQSIVSSFRADNVVPEPISTARNTSKYSLVSSLFKLSSKTASKH
jgi:hypothetical protein